MVVQNALYSYKELKKSLFSIVIHIPWIYLEAFLGKLLAYNEEPLPPGLASEALKMSQLGGRRCLPQMVFLSLMKGSDLKVLQELSSSLFSVILVGWRRGHVYANQYICSVQEFFKNHEFSIRGLVCYKYNNKFIPFHSSLDCETGMWLWFFMTGIPRFITILSLYYCDIPRPPIICNSVF